MICAGHAKASLASFKRRSKLASHVCNVFLTHALSESERCGWNKTRWVSSDIGDNCAGNCFASLAVRYSE